jgi:hypothetical protein
LNVESEILIWNLSGLLSNNYVVSEEKILSIWSCLIMCPDVVGILDVGSEPREETQKRETRIVSDCHDLCSIRTK